MKRMILESSNLESGGLFGDLPVNERHNGKLMWRIKSPMFGEIVVRWQQAYYRVMNTRPIRHPKGFEIGFVHDEYRLTDRELYDATVISKMK